MPFNFSRVLKTRAKRKISHDIRRYFSRHFLWYWFLRKPLFLYSIMFRIKLNHFFSIFRLHKTQSLVQTNVHFPRFSIFLKPLKVADKNPKLPILINQNITLADKFPELVKIYNQYSQSMNLINYCVLLKQVNKKTHNQSFTPSLESFYISILKDLTSRMEIEDTK